MNKQYNFILTPSDFTWENPLSARKVTLAGAWRWAAVLAKFNPSAKAILFRSVNGRKTYRLINLMR
jgi:hypothetical protein